MSSFAGGLGVEGPAGASCRRAAIDAPHRAQVRVSEGEGALTRRVMACGSTFVTARRASQRSRREGWMKSVCVAKLYGGPTFSCSGREPSKAVEGLAAPRTNSSTVSFLTRTTSLGLLITGLTSSGLNGRRRGRPRFLGTIMPFSSSSGFHCLLLALGSCLSAPLTPSSMLVRCRSDRFAEASDCFKAEARLGSEWLGMLAETNLRSAANGFFNAGPRCC